MHLKLESYLKIEKLRTSLLKLFSFYCSTLSNALYISSAKTDVSDFPKRKASQCLKITQKMSHFAKRFTFIGMKTFEKSTLGPTDFYCESETFLIIFKHCEKER